MARVLLTVALVGAFVLWQVQHCVRVENEVGKVSVSAVTTPGTEIADRAR
jgi:hypothetical protein